MVETNPNPTLTPPDTSAQAKAVAAAASKAAAAPPPAPAPEVKKGDKVHLVHHRRGALAAEVTKVHRGGCLIDLETDEVDAKTGKPAFTITASPYDAAGKKADSWHPIAK